MPSEQLLIEGRQWLRRVVELHSKSLTLSQHREALALSGWLALLVGCAEYDTGDRHAAESTRRAALSLASEADHAEITGWAHEMRAWFALTTGDYRGVIAAAQAGTDVAPHQGVAVQLAGQEAKAWARLGDRRRVEVALDRGRNLLEGMPHPENLDNHFVVDPAKFDFYAMDCYRLVGEDKLARALAEEALRAGTDFDDMERSPMRNAEARVTLGVTAAREDDLEQALVMGERALEGERQAVPSLIMTSRELARNPGLLASVTEGAAHGRAILGSSLRSRATAFGSPRPPRASGPTRTQRARRVGTVPATLTATLARERPAARGCGAPCGVQSIFSPSYIPPLQVLSVRSAVPPPCLH